MGGTRLYDTNKIAKQGGMLCVMSETVVAGLPLL